MSLYNFKSRALSQLAAFNTPGNRELSPFLDGARRTRSCTYNVSATKRRSLSSTKVKSTTIRKLPTLTVAPLPSPSPSPSPSPELPPIVSASALLSALASACQLSPSSSNIINDVASDDDIDLSYNPPLNTPASPSNATYLLAAQRGVARIQSSINKASSNPPRLSDEDLTLEPSQSLLQIAHHKHLSLRVPVACRTIFIEAARKVLQRFNDA